MKVLVGAAFNLEKALVKAFFMIVKRDGWFAAPLEAACGRHQAVLAECSHKTESAVWPHSSSATDTFDLLSLAVASAGKTHTGCV